MTDRKTAPDVREAAPARDPRTPAGPPVPLRAPRPAPGPDAGADAERDLETAALHAALAAYRADAPYDAALYADAEAHALIAGGAPPDRLRALRARLEGRPGPARGAPGPVRADAPERLPGVEA